MIKIEQVALLGAALSLFWITPALCQQTEEASERGNRRNAKRSYIGVGGNLGLSGGESAIGGGAFVIVSRNQIINYLSIRSSTIIGDEFTSAIALTGELPITNSEGEIKAIPFLGGGVAIYDEIAPLVSLGVDVPVSRDFTLTNRLNVGFGDDETDVGVVVGVGYNFSLF